MLSDSIVEKYLAPNPTITAKHGQNLRDHLVKSHYQGIGPKEFNKKNPDGDVYHVIAVLLVQTLRKQQNSRILQVKIFYKIMQHITCTTKAVVYYAMCTCSKIYVGLTSRELKMCEITCQGHYNSKRSKQRPV